MNLVNNRWPLSIGALFFTFALFNWWSIHKAATGVSAVSDPDYIHHGQEYNRTSLERQAGESLDWTIRPLVRGRELTLRVTDSHGGTVSGATGTILTPREGNGQAAELRLTESSPGLYTATLPAALPASFSATLSLRKDQATITRPLLVALDES